MSHGGGEGPDERWLVSYADFITLLMVLFVVLYSMSQVDVQRYKQLADGLRLAFNGEDPVVVDPEIDLGGSLSEDEEPAPIVVSGIPKVRTDAVEVAGQLTDMLASSDLAGMVSVQNNIEGVLISLSEQLLYLPGTAELQPEAYTVLSTLVEMIRPIDNEVRVFGHADPSPPLDPRYSSSWELSTARAITIVNYFQAAGIAPERLVAAGVGEYRAILPNDSDENRVLNGRSEIVVVYPLSSEMLNSDLFNIFENDALDVKAPENGELP